MLVGLTDMLESSGDTLICALTDAPPLDAIILAEPGAVNADVLTVNVPVVDPAGIVMLDTAGVATPVLLLERFTTVPPAGDATERVTVPVECALDKTLVGLSVRDCNSGTSVNWPEIVAPPYAAEIVTAVLVDTELVVIVKVAVVAPAEKETVAGTVVIDALLVVMVRDPPAGAAPLK
jgi:hypothetical protein